MMSSIFDAVVTELYHAFNSPTSMADVHRGTLAASPQPDELTDSLRRRSLLTKEDEPAVSHIFAEARKATTVSRIPGVPAFGTYDRIVVPLRVGGILVGWIFLMDKHRNISIAEVETFQPVFDNAARHAYIQQHARYKVWNAVSGLLSADETARTFAAELLTELAIPKPGSPLRIVAIDVGGAAGMNDAISWQRVFGMDAGYGEMAGALVVLMSDGSSHAVERVARLMSDPNSPASGARVGIGAAVEDLHRARESYKTALASLRFANSAIASKPVANWEQLGFWRTLLMLTQEQALASTDSRVAALLNGASADDLKLVRSYLERDTDAGAIAAALHVHRTTLYARLRKLSQDFSLDWDQTEDRMATIVGLRLNLLANSPLSR